jgi:cytochrome c551/c552
MPAFYGMHEHLSRPALAEALRYEPVELHAMAAYLLDVSQPARPLPVPPGVTEPPSAERGRRLFQLRGCLACHKHEAFPEAQSTEGPDLSRLASKFTQPEASPWLVDWIRDPARHSPRTTMPDALLEPEPLEDVEHGDLPPEAGESPESAEGEPGKMTDPAADIAAFLLRPSEQPWRPGPLPALVERDLDGLALEHLAAVYPRPRAEQILAEGIPFDQAAEFEGDAVALLGPPTLRKKLRYVGRRTIRKRGCAGCHDIPGFEQATLIGPALSDWGRKRESLLAFEQVHRFLAENEPAPSRSPGDEAIGRPETDRAASGSGRATKAEAREAATADDVPELVGGDRRDVSLPLFEEQDRAFYRHAIAGQRREGFIWQKLRAPRSFDYHKAIHKPYNERLTMGRFRLAAAEREAIITFVLGLVGEAPPDRYVYTPDGRRRAIVEGRKVLDRFACAECHTMAMPRWQFEYDPEWFEDPPPLDGFAFNQPQITPEQVAASLEVDRRGLGHAEVVGRPRVDAEGRLIEDEDYDGHPLYFFTLWDPAVINGRVWRVGGPEVMISRPQITGRTPPWGGAFSRLLFPIVVERAREEGGATTAVQSWGWVPPPLVSEGWMARPAWLHRYLLEPTEIRPSVVLRMPRYTLASAEATQLVDYFAATSGQEYPYAPAPQRPTDRGPAADATGGHTGRPDEQPAGNDRPSRLDRAMRVVLDRTTYCAKCHQIGDFTPGGQIDTILAPNLADVHRRLRPDYVRHWLANPKSVLPYTGMPVNFPPAGPPLGQDLFPGSSLEQLDAVVDLLLNYDWYVGRQLSIRQWIERLEAADQPDPQGQNR